MTHEISIFVKILFNFKKKILAWIKSNMKTLNILQKPRIWIDYIMSLKKSNLSKTHMEQSVESNFFKKFKAIASLPILRPYFSFFFKERFFRKSSKPGHGNLVLITSTVQVELSKLNFNFDDIRTYFLQVLRDCRQITFVTLNGFVY